MKALVAFFVRQYRSRVSLVVVLCLAALVQQPSASASWRINGNRVVGALRTQTTPAIIADGSGGSIVAWADYRSDTADIYAQRMSDTGVPLWGSTGLPICTSLGTQDGLQIVSDGNGGAFIAWLDSRTGSPQPFVQRVTSSGSTAFTANGIPLVFAGTVADRLNLAADGIGGAIAVWQDHRLAQSEIWAQRVNGTGGVFFGPDGTNVTNSSRDETIPAAMPDGGGGVIMAWLLPDSSQVRAQRVDMHGDNLWGPGGVPINAPSGCASCVSSIKLCTDGSGGSLISWGSLAQRLNGSGAPLWTPGGVSVTGGSGIAPDGGGGAFTLQRRVLNPGDRPSITELRAQHVGATGAAMWGSDGKVLSGFTFSERIEYDGVQGALVTWQDSEEFCCQQPPPRTYIHAQRLDASGNFLWGSTGIATCDSSNGRTPALLATGSGGALITWSGNHEVSSDYDIYLRRLGATGLSLITLNSGSGGSIQLTDPGPITKPSVRVGAYDEAMFRFTPSQGYFIQGVTLDGNAMEPQPNWDLGHATVDHVLSANFANGTWTSPTILTPARTYTTVAFPLTFTLDSVSSVLNSLGPFNDDAWRMARWDPVANGYQFAGSGLRTLKPGAGYWVITAGGAPVQATGRPVTTDPFAVELDGTAASGWNQIGNPYRFAIADTALQVTAGGAPIPFLDAANTYTDRKIWEWTGGVSYAEVHTLRPWRAYWIRKRVPTSVQLVFPDRASSMPTTTVAVKPAEAEWAVALSAHQGPSSTMRVLVGRWRGASAPLQVEAPPHSLSPGLSMRLFGGVEKSATHVAEFTRADGPWAWDFELRGSEVPGEIRLDVEGHDLPAGLTLWLTDPARGWATRLVPGESVTIASFQGVRKLRLQALYGVDGPAGQMTAPLDVHAVYPNPFRERMGLLFRLGKAGDVQVRIFDVQGRFVRLVQARGLTAGEHVLQWDGRSQVGSPVSGGVYFIRGEVGGQRFTTRVVKLE